MLDQQIVTETISRMRNSGIGDNVIAQTLKDIGLSEDEIKSYLKTGSAAPGPAESPRSSQADFAADETDSESEEPPSGRASDNEALHTTTHAAIEEQTGLISGIDSKLNQLDSKLNKLSSLPIDQFNETLVRLDKKISSLQNELNDTKTQLAAYKTVIDKLLETNRQIVTELQAKK